MQNEIPVRPDPFADVSAPDEPPVSPLSEEQFAVLRKGAASYKAVRKAARRALWSAVVTLAIGVLAIPFNFIMPGWQNVFVTVAVCAVGCVEFVGYRRFQRADPSAGWFLGMNQLAFIGAVLIYCVWQMIAFDPDTVITADTRMLFDAMPEMESMVTRLAPLLTYGFYAGVAFMVALSQGLLALYYFTRKRHILAFNQSTPDWVRRIFKEISY